MRAFLWLLMVAAGQWLAVVAIAADLVLAWWMTRVPADVRARLSSTSGHLARLALEELSEQAGKEYGLQPEDLGHLLVQLGRERLRGSDE